MAHLEDAVEGVRERDVGESEPQVLRHRARVEDEPDLEALRGVRVDAHEAVHAPLHRKALLEDVRAVDPHVPHVRAAAADGAGALHLVLQEVRVRLGLPALDPPVPVPPRHVVRVREAPRNRVVAIEHHLNLLAEGLRGGAGEGPRHVAAPVQPAHAKELKVGAHFEPRSLGPGPVQQRDHRGYSEKGEEEGAPTPAEHDAAA